MSGPLSTGNVNLDSNAVMRKHAWGIVLRPNYFTNQTDLRGIRRARRFEYAVEELSPDFFCETFQYFSLRKIFPVNSYDEERLNNLTSIHKLVKSDQYNKWEWLILR